MRWFGFCVVVYALVGACGESKSDHGSANNGGVAGGTTAATGALGGDLISLGGAGGNPASTGGAPDIDSIQAPLVHCSTAGAAGSGGDGGDGGDGGWATAEGGSDGAPFDDACVPPPSQCLGDVMLVFFDEGECREGDCVWVKKSMKCRNACFGGGCQDSITTR